jgi:hypothetical protein
MPDLQFFFVLGGFVALIVLAGTIATYLQSIDRHLATIAFQTRHNDANLGEIARRLADLQRPR